MSSITLPNTLDTIKEDAFEHCTSLAEVDLSSTAVTTIGQWTFHGCKSMSSIKLPGTLESIEQGAFSNCKSLAEVDLYSTSVTILESIECRAFYGCTSLAKDLSSIVIPRTVKYIGQDAFNNSTSLKMVIVPWGADIQHDTFPDCTKVLRQHNWYELGEYIKMRALLEQNRAVAKDVDDAELQILQKLILNDNNVVYDDIFRLILEDYLCQKKP